MTKRYEIVPMRGLQTENLNQGFKQVTAGRQFGEVITESVRAQERVVVSAPEAARLPKAGQIRKTGLIGTWPSQVHPRSGFLEPQIRDPLLSASNFYLPTDRVVMNTWIRYFDRFHPIVGNAIDMHATVPFSKFALKDVKDQSIRHFFEDMVQEINLFRRILEISREYELIGEVFPFAYWDDEMNAFSDIVVLNPDQVEVIGLYIAGEQAWRFELVPDPTVLAFLRSDNPMDWELLREIDPAIIRAAQTNTNAPLDPFNLSHLARKQSPYDERGTSIIMGCIKDLMYEEQLLEAQYAVAGGIVRPREIWKLGNQNYMPTDQDLEDFRLLLASSQYDPNFALISHYALAVDFVGADRRILPIIPERQQIEERLLTRLYTNKAITHGEGPTYSNASVAMQFISARYATKRDFITEWIREKIFTPTSLANEFYKPLEPFRVSGQGPWLRVSQKERELVIPEFQWLSLVDLTDRGQKIQYAMQLASQNRLPLKTILDLLQIDSSEVEYWLEREEGSRLDPVWQSVRKTTEEGKARAQAVQNVAPGGGGSGGSGGGSPQEKLDEELKQSQEQSEKETSKPVTPAKELPAQPPAPKQAPPATPSGTATGARVFGDEDSKKKKEHIFAGIEHLASIVTPEPTE